MNRDRVRSNVNPFGVNTLDYNLTMTLILCSSKMKHKFKYQTYMYSKSDSTNNNCMIINIIIYKCLLTKYGDT